MQLSALARRLPVSGARRSTSAVPPRGYVACAGARRAAARATAPPRRAGRSSMTVVAFREDAQPPRHKYAHADKTRTDQLTGLAREVLGLWAGALTADAAAWTGGGRQAVMDALAGVVDPDVKVKAAYVLDSFEGKGVEALGTVLDRQRAAYGGAAAAPPRHTGAAPPAPAAGARVRLLAASEEDDVAFGLMEVDCGGAGAGAAMASPRVWAVAKMDIFLDDTARCVAAIEFRGQLPPTLTAAATARKAQPAGGPAVDESGVVPRPTPFPSDRVKPAPREQASQRADAMRRAAKAWCHVRDTAKVPMGEEARALDGVMDTANFRLWDAYGLLPLVCDPSASKAAGAPCVLGFEQTMDLIRATKDRFHIRCKMLETAACSTEAAGFTSWSSDVRDRTTGVEERLDAIEVDIFDASSPTPQLTDVWLFRDPMATEAKALRKDMA